MNKIKEKPFRPMLLSNDEYNLEDLDYTDMVISKKLDGVRFEITRDGVFGRSMKKIPNKQIQELYEPVCKLIPENFVLEGEFWSPFMPCREIAGLCNRSDTEIPLHLNVHVFDLIHTKSVKEDTRRLLRSSVLYSFFKDNALYRLRMRLIECHKVYDAKDAKLIFEAFIKEGEEGAVMYDNTKFYKQGRVTIKQGIAFKLKPHKEEDLVILGVTERLKNLNESMTDELGHSFKRNTKEDKEGTGIAAAFICKYKDTTTKVTLTGTEEERKEIWDNKEEYIGKYAVVKSMDFGAKDKLRHPRLLGIKESLEK